MDCRSCTRLGLSAAVLSAVLFAGCDGKKSAPKTDDGKSPKTEPVTKTGDPTPDVPKPAVKPKPFVPPATVTLKDVTPKQLQAEIAKHKGHVVLVDYWAMWCQPCKRSFPHTVALGKKHAKDGLVVVSMCLDALGSREKAMKFLESNDSRLVNLFASEKLDPDMLTELFEVGNLPYYRIYGADGKFVVALKPGDTEEPKQFQAKLDAAVLAALGLP